MKRFGCLIVGFRRTSELIQVMTKVREESFDKVFISIDGSTGMSAKVRNENRMARQSAEGFVSQYGLDWDLNFPATRLGIIRNFTSSIDKAFETVDFLCVLEDDCIPSSGLLEYFKGLSQIQVSNKVCMFTFFRPELPVIGEGYFLTHNPLMWGWGISKENWLVIKKGVLVETRVRGLAKNLTLPFQSFYYSGYIRAKSGESDALDALIAYFLIVNDFLVLGPPVNLVSNIGYGDSATNTKNISTYMNSPTSNWEKKDFTKPKIKLKRFSILKNDYSIARKMNGWKLHHLISNVFSIKLLALFRGSSNYR